MFRLATGKNLFSTSITRSSWAVADDIKVFRDECYQTPELLETRLNQINIHLKDEKFKGVREIMRALLTSTIPDPTNTSFAHPDHYHKLKELYNSYTNPDMISGYEPLE